MDTEMFDDVFFRDEPVKRDIVLAIEDLSREEPIDGMTIQEICDRAHVSRTTFYRHFKDKVEACEWAVLRASAFGFGSIGRQVNCREGLTLSLRAAERFRQSFMASGSSGDKTYAALRRNFDKFMYDMYFETITKYKRLGVDEGLDFVLRAWTRTLGDCLDEWRWNGFKIPVDRMAEYLERSMPCELRDVFNERSA